MPKSSSVSGVSVPGISGTTEQKTGLSGELFLQWPRDSRPMSPEKLRGVGGGFLRRGALFFCAEKSTAYDSVTAVIAPRPWPWVTPGPPGQGSEENSCMIRGREINLISAQE